MARAQHANSCQFVKLVFRPLSCSGHPSSMTARSLLPSRWTAGRLDFSWIMRNAAAKTVLICLVLVAATTAVYWPVRTCDFVNFDDGKYVAANPHVRTGLSWEGVRWAFAARE